MIRVYAVDAFCKGCGGEILFLEMLRMGYKVDAVGKILWFSHLKKC